MENWWPWTKLAMKSTVAKFMQTMMKNDSWDFHWTYVGSEFTHILQWNGMESSSKNKKKQSIGNLFYHFLKGFLEKIELW